MLQIRIRDRNAPDMFAFGIPPADAKRLINDDVCMTDLGAPINSPLGFMCVAADMAELIEVILHVVDLPIKVTPEMIWVPAPRKRFASRPYWVRYISTSDK